VKVNYNVSNKWKLGDVIHCDNSLFLVVSTQYSAVADAEYSLIDLESGRALDHSYPTLEELQRQLSSKSDTILHGTFNYDWED